MPHSIELTHYGTKLKLVDNITRENLAALSLEVVKICKILKDDDEVFGTLLDLTEVGSYTPRVTSGLAEIQHLLVLSGSRRLAIVYDTAVQIVDAHMIMGKKIAIDKRYICTDIYEQPFEKAVEWLEHGTEP